MKIALIDADGLLYHSSKTTLEESLASIDDRINNIIIKTDCDMYALFLSSKVTFRNTIYPDYKAKRKKHKSRLLWLKTLRAYLVEKYNAYTMDNVEADDLVAYFHHNGLCVVGNSDIGMYIDTIPNIQGIEMEDIKYEVIETIICSTDKDILMSISAC
jgi:5'-3' exonuclease